MQGTHQPIFLHQIGHHIPLTTVAHRLRQQPLHQPPIQILARRINDLLHEEIRLLQLIPEEEIGLTELERLQVVLAHQGHAKHVGGGEEPTSAGSALVRDRAALERDLDVEVLRVGDGGRALREDGGRGVGRQRGQRETVLDRTQRPVADPHCWEICVPLGL